jgi:hypothetical protein
MALQCGDNLFTGTMTQGVDATDAVSAYELAVEWVEKRIARHVQAFVDGLSCPEGQGCGEKRYDRRTLAVTVRRLAGRPSYKINGYYWIEVEAHYTFIVRCDPTVEEVQPPPPEPPRPPEPPPGQPRPPEPPPEPPRPPEPPVQCTDPSPPIVYPIGYVLVPAVEWPTPVGAAVSSAQGYQDWRDTAPQLALDALMAAASCGPNCEPYFDPPAVASYKQRDLGTKMRTWFVLEGEVRVRCRPR